MTKRSRPGIDLDRLRGMVSPAVWARGEDYAARGLVSLTSVTTTRLMARVEGSETYRCILAGKNLREMSCSCPAFEEFDGPCKHLVATALTLVHRSEPAESLPADRLRRFLSGRPPAELVELLLGLAEADPDLEERLLLQADAADAEPAKLRKVLERAVSRAVRTGDFVDYRRMAGWADGVDAVIDQLLATARAGHEQAAVVLDLVPALIAGIERAVEHTDDDGHIGMLLDRCIELLGVAALGARPDPGRLGQSIARLDLDCEYAEVGPPAGALAKALGEEGLAAYWSSLEAEWARLQPQRPAERTGRGRIDDDDVRRWQLRQRLVARARERGDVDAEIAILAKCLATSHDYLEVAKLCHAHGRVAEAVSWIDQALWLFGSREEAWLARESAPILAAAGETDRALALLWERFRRHPSLESYQDMERLAGPVGEAAAWRGRVVDWLEQLRRGDLAEAERPSLYGETASARAADVLVELAIAARDLDRAWEVAGTATLSRRVRQRLAKASEVARPLDSIRIYQALADDAVATRRKQGYRDAVDLVRVIERLGESAEGGPTVDAWISALRARHKAKRSFIAMLDAAAS